MKEIRIDPQTKQFTFKAIIDGRRTVSVRPPKFSPEDKYAKYRRAGMEQQRKKDGLFE
jgi:rRNA maturation protein Nop10